METESKAVGNVKLTNSGPTNITLASADIDHYYPLNINDMVIN
jgi:hypothetical protein